MKKWLNSFYARLSVVFLLILLFLGLGVGFITVQALLKVMNEADQHLNENLANDMAKEFAPCLTDSIDYKGIENVIHYMMVMNPKIEIYLLDQNGKILAFFAEPAKKVKTDSVSLEPIQRFLASDARILILGDDPRHPTRKKPFSAAPIQIGRDMHGYLYIVIGSEQFEAAFDRILNSYIFHTLAKALALVLLVTAVIGLLFFALLTRRLRKMTDVVREFQNGQIDRRIPAQSDDEIGQLSSAFNQMADTIVADIEALKQTDTLRRELVANVSHDLRSPLASIQGYLETILIKDATLLPEERKKYLDIIWKNTALLNKQVSELFELSKLDAKQIKPLYESFSIAELIQDVMMKFKPHSEKAGISLQVDLAPDLPLVNADIGLIERVLSNLLDNALRFTQSGGTVQVKLANLDGRIRIAISDTGCGIAPEDLTLLFDRFSRLDNTRQRLRDGTGLGLAIAKKIMDLHNGSISVESQINQGTTFYVDLPINDQSV